MVAVRSAGAEFRKVPIRSNWSNEPLESEPAQESRSGHREFYQIDVTSDQRGPNASWSPTEYRSRWNAVFL